MLRILVLSSALIAVATATINAPCSARDGIGSGKCDTGEVCCSTATTIGTGENVGTCKTKNDATGANEGCAVGTEQPLCDESTSSTYTINCPACSGTATPTSYSVPCSNCPKLTPSSTSDGHSCSSGTCECNTCPFWADDSSNCNLGDSEDLDTSGLATGLLIIIILCVLVFVVLPIVCIILICCCGVALCGMGAKAATDAPVAQGGQVQMHAAPPAGAAQPVTSA